MSLDKERFIIYNDIISMVQLYKKRKTYMSVTVENLDHNSVNEAYLLLTAYLREDKIGASYNKEHLLNFVNFLHDVLKNPNNFIPVVLETPEEN